MKNARHGLLLVLLPIALMACGPQPTPGAAEVRIAPAATPAPPGLTELPDLAVCETWARRKSGECRDDILSLAPSSPPDSVPLFTPYSLYESCVLFGECRVHVARCVAADECARFAACTGEAVGQRWDPRLAPDLCDAFLRRKTGSCKPAIQELLWQLPPEGKPARLEATYALYDRCGTDPAIHEAIAGCMMMKCDEFAPCVMELAQPVPAP